MLKDYLKNLFFTKLCYFAILIYIFPSVLQRFLHILVLVSPASYLIYKFFYS